jgi:hypothetical protein
VLLWFAGRHRFVGATVKVIIIHTERPEITTHPLEVPEFDSEIIRKELSSILDSGKSFGDIVDILKQNEFQIVRGFHSAEVSVFVSRVELAEQSVHSISQQNINNHFHALSPFDNDARKWFFEQRCGTIDEMYTFSPFSFSGNRFVI